MTTTFHKILRLSAKIYYNFIVDSTVLPDTLSIPCQQR